MKRISIDISIDAYNTLAKEVVRRSSVKQVAESIIEKQAALLAKKQQAIKQEEEQL